MIAAKLMTAWNLPSRICNAVEFYHAPDAAPEAYREITGLTQFAYRIAAMSQIGNNEDRTLMDLESAWISKQADSPLAKKELQAGIVEDILTTLDKKSASITGVSPPEKEIPLAPEPSPARQQHSAALNNAGSNVPKKGLIGWIKSLFN